MPSVLITCFQAFSYVNSLDIPLSLLNQISQEIAIYDGKHLLWISGRFFEIKPQNRNNPMTVSSNSRFTIWYITC